MWRSGTLSTDVLDVKNGNHESGERRGRMDGWMVMV